MRVATACMVLTYSLLLGVEQFPCLLAPPPPLAAFSGPDANTLYLIDFGLAETIKSAMGESKPATENGTPLFSSRSAGSGAGGDARVQDFFFFTVCILRAPSRVRAQQCIPSDESFPSRTVLAALSPALHAPASPRFQCAT